MRELLEKRGVTSFCDRDLLVGLPWGQALEKELRRVRAVAVFLGKTSLGRWQKREVGFALERQVEEEERGHSFPVIPVLLEGATPEISFLLHNTWVDLRDDLTDPQGINALAGAVRGRKLAARDFTGVCPYLGLKPFREEDAAFFRGRKKFTDNLLRMVLDRDLVAVLGGSGSGKSSVIHAGLLPALRRQRPPADTWDAISFTPGSEPFRRLATSVLPLLEPDMTETERFPEIGKLAGDLAGGRTRLEDVLARVCDKSRGTDRLLLIADQFEELLTLAPSEDQRPFVEMLLQACAKRSCSLLLSLRGEFYGRTLELSRELSDLLQEGIVNVGPLTQAELEQAIKEPADRVGLEFEEGLVTTILKDAMGQPGNLPLLEFALRELCPEGGKGSLLTHKRYKDIGEVGGAVAWKADKTFGAFDSEGKRIVKHLFTQLVRVARPGEGTVDTRRRALRSKLAPWAESSLVDGVIHKLAEERLITITGGGQEEEPVGVEMAHEALLRKWSALADWIDAERADLLTHRWLSDEATAWMNHGRDPGFRLRGARLAQAQEWEQRHKEEPTPLEREFLQDSVKAIEIEEQRQREQRQALLDEINARAEANRGRAEAQAARADAESAKAKEEHLRAEVQARLYRAEKRFSQRLTRAVVALIGLSLLALGFAWYSDVQKKKATWRNLLLKSEAVLAGEPELGLLLALEALELEKKHRYLRPPAAETTLRRALAHSAGTPLESGEVDAAAVSPDHRWLVTAGADNSVRRWDLKSKDPAWVQTTLKGAKIRAGKIAISRDGRLIAIYSPDERNQGKDTIHLWSPEERTLPGPIFGEDWLGPTPFSADGRLVTREFGLRLRRTLASQPRELQASPTVVAFHPREPWLAAGDSQGTVSLRNLENQSTRELSATGPAIVALAFSPDGAWLISAGADGSVAGWRRSEGGWGTSIAFRGCERAPDALEIDPGGVWLFGWGKSPSACLWKLAEPAAPACDLLGPDRGEITAATFIPGPGGQRLFTAERGAVRWLDLRSSGCDQIPSQYEGTPATLLAGVSGNRLLIAGADRTPRLLDLAKDNPFDSDEPRVVRTFGGPFTVALSSDGRFLALGGPDGKILLRSLEPPAQPIRLQGQQDPVTALAFNADRRLLASGAANNTIHLWDLAARSPHRVEGTRMHNESVAALAFSRGNRWLVAGGGKDGTFLSWKRPATTPTDWTLLNHTGGVGAISFSRDGQLLVTAGADGYAWPYRSPWNSSAKPFVELERQRSGLTSVALSPDGQYLATASAEGPAWLWRLQEKEKEEDETSPSKPIANLGALTALAFSHDGGRLAAGGRDHNVRLWNFGRNGSLQPSVVLGEHQLEIRAVAFSPDGRWLVTADAEGTARRWDLSLVELKKRACEKAGRNLTREEWQMYFSNSSYRRTCRDWPSPP